MVTLKRQGPRKKRRVRLDQKLLDENNQAKITKRTSGRAFGGYNKPQSSGGRRQIANFGSGWKVDRNTGCLAKAAAE